MAQYPSLSVRIWRTRPWNTNPLMRASDRFEALVRMLAVAAMLVAIPIAGAVGTAGYTAAAARIIADNSAKVAVTGTISGEVKHTAIVSARSEMTESHAEAPVRWNQDGRSGTATIEAPDTATRGDKVTVWLAPDGTPTRPPQRSSVAVGNGIEVGLAVLVEIWGAVLALVALIMWALGARRRAGWEREWRQTGWQTGSDRR
ncbi:Rv1733c family protein [Nocardia sp. CA-129566]|uniref:Rv1733c family protein n=1 Tax=Nocardia sp. CA-129566 TaxID=3239976 RepID=UPI003D95884D